MERGTDKHMVIEEYPDTHGDYRYLWRKRDLNIGGKVDLGEAVFLMRNPATEEEEGEEEKGRRKGRHTTRNICRTIAERLGYTVFTEINLFALRAKDMPTLREAHSEGRDIVGPENDEVICEVVSKANLVIVAWGSPGGASQKFRSMYAGRVKEVRSFMGAQAQQAYCLQKKNADTVNFPPQPLGSSKVDGMEDLIPWPPVL